ncbi:hypothetical protein QBC34DRAFT_442773 [Podospora aff. communis PSN243]|uniref:Uncharacterized protein n=1 Tax=Podospora aff. communis PSN243 TaxID=3040156 RepID=A0AAV9G9P7_9PEZI|nr:hypothetical protein QBC34DRAFT_442773 [Podospora aff. communis PSN243]
MAPRKTSAARSTNPGAKSKKPQLSSSRVEKRTPTRASRRQRGLPCLTPEDLALLGDVAGVMAASSRAHAGRVDRTKARGQKPTGPFNFMRLPTEIRLQIYRELLVSPNPIDIDWENPRLFPQILQTCKAIFCEAHPVLYDENTWNIHVGTSPKHTWTVPNLPPFASFITPETRATWERLEREGNFEALRTEHLVHNAKLKADGCLRGRHYATHSYFNDVFPSFMDIEGGLGRKSGLVCNLLQPDFNRDLFKESKFPRHLVVVISEQTTAGWGLVLLGRALQNIPQGEIRSLTFTYEGSRESWETRLGQRLTDQLRTFVAGRVRGVREMRTEGIPEDLSALMIREMTGVQPVNTLLLMWEALERWKKSSPSFKDYALRILTPGQYANNTIPVYYNECQPAMVRGEWKGFVDNRRLHLKQYCRVLGYEPGDVARVFESDPDDLDEILAREGLEVMMD